MKKTSTKINGGLFVLDFPPTAERYDRIFLFFFKAAKVCISLFGTLLFSVVISRKWHCQAMHVSCFTPLRGRAVAVPGAGAEPGSPPWHRDPQRLWAWPWGCCAWQGAGAASQLGRPRAFRGMSR